MNGCNLVTASEEARALDDIFGGVPILRSENSSPGAQNFERGSSSLHRHQPITLNESDGQLLLIFTGTVFTPFHRPN